MMRKLILSLFILFSSTTVNAELSNDEKKLILESREYLKENNIIAANSLLLKAIQSEDGAHAKIYLELGYQYINQNQAEQAQAIYEQGYKVYPKDKGLNKSLGGIYFQKKKYKQAAEHFQKGIENTPPSKDELKNLSYALYYSGQELAAEKGFALAVFHYPNDLSFRKGLLNCLLKMENYSEALTVCRDTLRLFPKELEIRKILGQIYLSVGNDEKGIDVLESVLLLSSKEDRVRESLADLYLRRGMFIEASSHYQSLDEKIKNSPRLKIKIARLDHENEEYEKSKILLLTLKEADRNEQAKSLLAANYFRLGNWSDAIIEYQRLTKVSANKGLYFYRLGVSAQKAKKWALSKTSFAKAKLFSAYRQASLSYLVQIALEEDDQRVLELLISEGLRNNPRDKYFLNVQQYLDKKK